MPSSGPLLSQQLIKGRFVWPSKVPVYFFKRVNIKDSFFLSSVTYIFQNLHVCFFQFVFHFHWGHILLVLTTKVLLEMWFGSRFVGMELVLDETGGPENLESKEH